MCTTCSYNKYSCVLTVRLPYLCQDKKIFTTMPTDRTPITQKNTSQSNQESFCPFCQVCSGTFMLHISGQVVIVGSCQFSLCRFGICQFSLSRTSSDLFVWGWVGSCQDCLDRGNSTLSALVWSCVTGLIGCDEVASVMSDLGIREISGLVLSTSRWPDLTWQN